MVAVQGNHVLSLFEEPSPAWQRFFPNVNYSTQAMQFHIIETDFEPPDNSIYLPLISNEPINNIGFLKSLENRWLLLTGPNVTLYDPKDPDEVLIKRSVEAITRLFPELTETFVAHRIFRWPEKVPTFRPGYLGALTEFWKDPQEGPVYFCGDYFGGPSTGAALYTGLECAERLLSQ